MNTVVQARRRGFTLIELLVTLAILGLLGSLAIPAAQVTIQRRSEQELRTSLHLIRKALDEHKQAYDDGRIAKTIGSNGYPKSLEQLVEGVPDLRNPKRAKIYFLRRLPRDPFADAGADPLQSWGKRSYASPPDAPTEGADIYDVYSLAPGTGLPRSSVSSRRAMPARSTRFRRPAIPARGWCVTSSRTGCRVSRSSRATQPL